MKAESLHFSHVLIFWFKIHYFGAQKQNYTKEISHCLQIYGPNLQNTKNLGLINKWPLWTSSFWGMLYLQYISHLKKLDTCSY